MSAPTPAIRVRNLRSLVATPLVELKPLTLLVGANSSGKSTFLRVFPLLRQSIEARTTGPILWYGDLVDFGTFENARRLAAGDEPITFEFHLPLAERERRRWSELPGSRVYPRPSLLAVPALSVELDLRPGADGVVTYVSELRLRIGDHAVLIEIDENGFVTGYLVNDSNILELGGRYFGGQLSSFVPLLWELQPVPGENAWTFASGHKTKAAQALFAALRPLFHGNTKSATIRRVMTQIPVTGDDQALLDHLKAEDAGSYYKDQVARLRKRTRRFQRIRDLIMAFHIAELLGVVDRTIQDLATSVTYLAPLRAAAERFYRLQGLAVDQVDYEGRNMAMVLRSLSTPQQEDFAAWLSEYLEVSAKAVTRGAQLSVEVAERERGAAFNLADVGFGLSQLLPVVMQLWLIMSGRHVPDKAATVPVTLTLEQPELHLHPRMQARVADILLDAIQETAGDDERRVSLLVETHSEAFVNRIGERVFEEKTDPRDVQILVFEKDVLGDTHVTMAEYDEAGFLRNWPVGFFHPREQS